MSRPYATPRRLEPAPSRALCAWLLAVHAVALVLLPLLLPGFWPGALAAAAVLFSLWHSLRLHVTLSHPDAVRALEWPEAGACRLRLASGRVVEARLEPQALLLPWLVIMHFRSDRGRVHHVLLTPDRLEQACFRRVRVRLMTGLNPAGA